jgi:hypothetical protein
MNDNPEAPEHRRLVDRIGDAMRNAVKNGREEFADKLTSIRDLVIEAEVAEGFAPRPDDELEKWMKRRYGKTKRRIPTSRLTP